MRNAKYTGKASSIPVGLACGVCSALVVTLMGAAGAAKLISMEFLKENQIGYIVMALLIIASWIGATISVKKVKREKLLICLLNGFLFFGTLLAITALFFGGQYSGVGETALLVFCGSVLAIFSGMERKKRWKHRPMKMGTC